MTDYMQFRLDGFHNRTLDKWRETVWRCETPASVVPARRIGNRTIPAHVLPASALVEKSNWRTTARKHAAEHGAAGVWHADDSFTLFYRDGAKVRQRRFPHARPAN